MRVFRGSHLKLVLAEFPLLFAISYFQIQVSEKGLRALWSTDRMAIFLVHWMIYV
ncbi:hypothetical protein SULPSESMR1_03563 (plasmid) [Pseudosulfitobacter pseudonitzschiae]|uniref:Uncharacterized protein n=1 Tax=Pseudosulfitobacter pseudonitzschiae TaxID=1402135 RepID=A0A221K9D4_9RHOB|nr:hypothetical protein SULPSESMR1_03563 [Pseudosulfitobacter pseudonitzschiae]